MKKYILKLGLFFLIFMTIVIGIGKLDNLVIPDNDNVNRIIYSSDYDSLDYLFLGNSATYSSINPLFFDSIGKKTYNFGFSTAGSEYFEETLNDYINNSTDRPKFLLFLMSPSMFTTVADNWAAYPIHRYFQTPLSNEKLAINHGFIKLYIPLLRKSFNRSLSNITSGLMGGKKSYNTSKQYLFKGFSPSSEKYTAHSFKKDSLLYSQFQKETFQTNKLNELIFLAEKYSKSGCTVLFYEVPDFRFREFLSEDFKQNYTNAFVLLNKKGFKIISPKLTIDSTLFRNLDHMNSKGAEVYTKALIKELKKETPSVLPK